MGCIYNVRLKKYSNVWLYHFYFSSLHLNLLIFITYCFTDCYSDNYNIDTKEYIIIMRETIIKIVYQTRLDQGITPWENHVNEILDGIESGNCCSFKVYMTYAMPIAEMDNVVKELCDSIKYRFNTIPKYYRHAECIAKDYIYLLSSATYYIEFN